ncbi:MAG: transposase [Sulfolobales archaeon]
MGCFLQASLALAAKDEEDALIVTRTVIVRSERIPKKLFRVFVELEGMYRNVVEQLVIHSAREGITSFIKLKALKYRETRNLYPHLPSHYVHTACQDASTRVKSFIKLKKEGSTKKEYPSVRRISIWLDDHLWRLDDLTRIGISTHKGLIHVDLIPHKQFYRYINSGWRLASEARIKLDKKERRLIVYLIFRKDVKQYKPNGYVAVDVNENNVAALINRKAYLLETNIERITLGYYYRRKRVQKKYDKICNVKCRAKKKILRRLREEERKEDTRWKVANVIVREALKQGYSIVLEDLGDNPAENMISRIKDEQLRHRIFMAAFKGIQKAIEEKAKEHGVPVIYVNPRNTSKQCPIHRSEIRYNGSRIGVCSLGKERWHRDVVACYNLLLKALGGDGSSAPSRPGHIIDGSHVPFGSTAAHDLTGIPRSLWARLKSLDMTMNKVIGMNIQGQTVTSITDHWIERSSPV